MRTMMTPEIAKLYREVEPYYDNTFHLISNAPKEIKEKEKIIQAYFDLEEAKEKRLNGK